MWSDLSIDDFLNVLGNFEPGKPQKKFLTHIRFPNFKNLRRGSRINFEFPITALVGVNGSGKTSVMHALQGAPERRSPASFWFTTELDPIESKEQDPQRFIYGHWHAVIKGEVETRKARVSKYRTSKGVRLLLPDYWEPTKEVIEDEMVMGDRGQPGVEGRSKSRWTGVSMDVLYTNFRSEISAFDKYFFFGSLKETKRLRSKQDRLRFWSSYLKPHLEQESGELRLRSDSKNLMHQNFELTSEELDAVSFILGKVYLSARVMDHSLYGGARGISVYFRNALGAGYSEAFAGSGEMSVVNLVTRLCRDVSNNALVLLDEPEVSLHPGAQERLLIFLMDQVKRRHHQIIFSTHAPAMIRHLPAKAIKVFVEGEDGRFDVIGDVDAKTAFGYLGEPLKEKINVYVEDGLALKIVQIVLRKQFSVQEADRYMIDVQPGGARTYFSVRIPTLMTRPEYIFFLLDGDMRPKEELKDLTEFSEQHLKENIDALIFAATGVKSVNLGSDGGDDPDAAAKHFERKKQYLRYIKNNVEFLPQPSPEHIILSARKEPELSSIPAHAKAKLYKFISAMGVEMTNKEIEAAAAMMMFTSFDAEDPNVLAIERILRKFLSASSGN